MMRDHLDLHGVPFVETATQVMVWPMPVFTPASAPHAAEPVAKAKAALMRPARRG